MALAKYSSFPKQLFIWGEYLEKTEDFIELYANENSSASKKSIFPYWKALLVKQDRKQKLQNNYPLTKCLSTIKEAQIPLLLEKVVEYRFAFKQTEYDYYSTFKNSFTLGLLEVEPWMGPNYIIVKNGRVDIYICKHYGSNTKYVDYVNSGKVLINEKLIQEDFFPPISVWSGSTFHIQKGQMYFFCALEFSCFTIFDDECYNSENRFREFSNLRGIPTSKKRSKEFDQFCLQPGIFISEMLKGTKTVSDSIENKNMALETVEKELRNMKDKYESKCMKLEAVQEELECVKSENIRLQAVEKVLEDGKNEYTRLILKNMELEKVSYDCCNKIELLESKVKELEDNKCDNIRLQAVEKAQEVVKNENTRLTSKITELEKVNYIHCNKIKLLEGKAKELENTKSKKIRLNVSETTSESVKVENKNLKAEIEEIKNGKDNYANKIKAIEEESEELQNIKSENIRLKLFFEQVYQLSKDICHKELKDYEV